MPIRRPSSIVHSSQSPTPALDRDVLRGQQASMGAKRMGQVGYRAAGQGIRPTSQYFGSQSKLNGLQKKSAGPNDPLWGDAFDMSQNAGDDTDMAWDGPDPKPIGGPRPQPFPQPQPGGPQPQPSRPNTPWMPGDPRPSPYRRPVGGPRPMPGGPRPNTPWMPGDPRPSPYRRPPGGPQPTRPTTPGFGGGFLDRGPGAAAPYLKGGPMGVMGDPGAAGAAGIGGDEFGGMPDMGIAGGPTLDPGIMAQQYPSGESGYNFPTPVIPNQRPIGPLPPNWKPTPGGEYKFPPTTPPVTSGLPDIDIDPISYTPPASLSPEEVMELTTFGGGSGGALMRPQMIGKPQDLAPWSGGPGDPFAGRPRPPRPPRPTPTGPQPRIRGPGNPYPSGSTPASRRRARERGGNPNDLRTGQGVSLGSDPRLHALAVGSGALPARPPRLTAGMWPGMV